MFKIVNIKIIEIFQMIILRLKDDILKYYNDKEKIDQINKIIDIVENNPKEVIKYRKEVDLLTPDSEDDGSWKCSYAINVGCIILNMIDYYKTKNTTYIVDSYALFNDTADFKSQEELQKLGNNNPNQDQISNHYLMVNEKRWLEELIKEKGW